MQPHERGGFDENKKIAWVNWGKVSLAKTKGGLGIPNLSIRNIALLGKWWNKFYDDAENEKLWTKIVVSKYYAGSTCNFIHNTTSSRLSSFWKDILSIDRVCDRTVMSFSNGFTHQLGDGSKTSFWKDIWLGSSPLKLEFPRLFNLTLDKESTVANLKPTNSESWNLQWRRSPFGRELDELKILEDTLRSATVSEGKADRKIWKHCPSRYSAKMAYLFLDVSPSCLDENICKLIWNQLMPAKVSVFTWRLCLNRLPTKDNLIQRGVDLVSNPSCVLCGSTDYVD
ncbi:hypothetical protein SLEP1_g56408 [Rubroshorea leprosula]|uniref:Reverse transcriptase zinc-binding domain-containing protein n=1 Tax=Rubroshorea leprosula TaxID=152421 RepID=A0AAV5MIP4_9ROSI|nr:hypothetical protein SLEP1_g56408 [Rubroshorea leprosula]